MERAVRAVKRLNPHPCRYSKAFRDGSGRVGFAIRNQPLIDEVAVWHITGKSILGGVASDDEGMTTTVGLDLDAHVDGQDPKAAARRFVAAANALDVPVVVHSSKSGKGIHIRTLFSECIPTFIARALFVALVLASGLNGEKSVDKIWPPSHGLGVLALPFNSRCARDNQGTLALDQHTLDPMPKDAQLSSILDAHEMSREDAERQLRAMGVRTQAEAALLSGQALNRVEWTDRRRNVRNGTDAGVQYLMRECAAVRELNFNAQSVSYEFWFGMMTNFRPFKGGYELFVALSELDPVRFNRKILDRSWKAISGGPRLCSHLDSRWECPLRAQCEARSPAGLPFAIARSKSGKPA